MKRFAYLSARDLAAASRAASESGNAVLKGAGTDLLDLMKERVLEPDEVVNLLGAAREKKPGEVHALATLADVAADPDIRRDFPALAIAAGEAATPQVRNVGTVGGNLCQTTRCWFLRTKGFECFKLGSDRCAAMADDAHNRYHAIFPHDSCASAHPSNLAPALVALGARVACVHPSGSRTLDAELLYEAPRAGKISDTTLRRGEVIRAVLLEPSPMTRNSTYLEMRERMSFDFAVASVAVAMHIEDNTVEDVRIVLGGVAPTPHRAREAEELLRGKACDPARAAKAAVAGARPLRENGFKVPIAERLVRRALEELSR